MGTQDKQSQLYLADELIGIVEGWEKTGCPGLTDTTYQLFKYWFKRDERSSKIPYISRTNEIMVYGHEVLQVKSLQDLYMKVAPNVLALSKAIPNEIQSVDLQNTV